MNEDARRPTDAHDHVPDWDTLARFVAGESPADERSRVSQWLEANPAERALLDRLTEVTVAPASGDVDVEAALAKVHARMAMTTDQGVVAIGSAPSKRRWPAPTAGILAAAVVVGIAIWSRQHPVGNPEQHATRALAQTYSTGVGQRDSIMLGDGSRVILGPDSRLTVPGGFGDGTKTSRALELRGDAYFDVRHDEAHPFEVQVGSALVQDIGTAFTVESDDANATVVTVLKGSVRLRPVDSAANAGVVLAAGQRGSIDEAGRTSHERAGSGEEDTAWTTGKLIFRDATLARVAAEVHRWYGVRLHVSDPALLSQHVHTDLYTNQSPDQVLHILELSLGVRIERQGGGDSAIVMSGRSTPQTPR